MTKKARVSAIGSILMFWWALVATRCTIEAAGRKVGDAGTVVQELEFSAEVLGAKMNKTEVQAWVC